jgi:hypothetical protein
MLTVELSRLVGADMAVMLQGRLLELAEKKGPRPVEGGTSTQQGPRGDVKFSMRREEKACWVTVESKVPFR